MASHAISFRCARNLRYGTVILRHYLDIERGDLFMALGRYNGSRGGRPYPRLDPRSLEKPLDTMK